MLHHTHYYIDTSLAYVLWDLHQLFHCSTRAAGNAHDYTFSPLQRMQVDQNSYIPKTHFHKISIHILTIYILWMEEAFRYIDYFFLLPIHCLEKKVQYQYPNIYCTDFHLPYTELFFLYCKHCQFSRINSSCSPLIFLNHIFYPPSKVRHSLWKGKWGNDDDNEISSPRYIILSLSFFP